MLQKTLRALKHGGTHRLRDLAKELGVSSELLESMLDELVRLGYTRRVEAACAASCAACCESATCVAGSSGRLWTLTERGQNAAQR